MIAVRKIVCVVAAQLFFSAAVSAFNAGDFRPIKDLVRPFRASVQLELAPGAGALWAHVDLPKAVLHEIAAEHPLRMLTNILFHEVDGICHLTEDRNYAAAHISVEQVGQLLLLLADEGFNADSLPKRIYEVLQASLPSALAWNLDDGTVSYVDERFVKLEGVSLKSKLPGLMRALAADDKSKLNGQYSGLLRALGTRSPEEIAAKAEAFDQLVQLKQDWRRRAQLLKQFAQTVMTIKTELPLFVILAQRILVTFMWLKAKSKEEFAPYLQRAEELGYLETPMPEGWQTSMYEKGQLKAQLALWNEVAACKGEDDHAVRSFVQDRELLIAGLLYQEGCVYPRLLAYRNLSRLNERGDCIETMLRNMFNVLLFNAKTQELDVAGRLEQLKKPDTDPARWQQFSTFYTTYPTLAAQDGDDARDAWLDIVSGIKGAWYKQEGVFELALSDFGVRMDCVMQTITGFTWSKFSEKYGFVSTTPPYDSGRRYQATECFKWCAPGAGPGHYLQLWVNGEGHGVAEYVGREPEESICVLKEHGEDPMWLALELLEEDEEEKRCALLRNVLATGWLDQVLHVNAANTEGCVPASAARKFAARICLAAIKLRETSLLGRCKQFRARCLATQQNDGEAFFSKKLSECLTVLLAERDVKSRVVHCCACSLGVLRKGSEKMHELFLEVVFAGFGLESTQKAFCTECIVLGYGSDDDVNDKIIAFLKQCGVRDLERMVRELKGALDEPEWSAEQGDQAIARYLYLIGDLRVEAMLNDAADEFPGGGGVGGAAERDQMMRRNRQKCVELAYDWNDTQNNKKMPLSPRNIARLRDGYLDIIIGFLGLEGIRDDREKLSSELKKYLPGSIMDESDIGEFLNNELVQGEAA